MNNSVAIAQINRIPSDGLSTSLEKEDAGNQLDQEVVDANIASSVMKDIQEINKIPTSFNITSFRGPPTPLEICMPVMLCEEEHPEVADRENATEENALINYQSPTVVASRVKIHLQRWGRVVPIHPVQFLHNILVNRGYEYNFIPTMAEKRK